MGFKYTKPIYIKIFLIKTGHHCMIFRSTILSLLFQLTLFITVYGNDVILISWNIRDFGKSRDEGEIRAISRLVGHADIVAIQEVVAMDAGGAQAVGRLVAELDRSGADWDYVISDPTHSPSNYVSERYAFLWKASKVKLMGNASLLKGVDEAVHREPYVAKFKIGNAFVTLVNYHSRTHKSGKDDEALEINAISNYLIHANIDNVIWSGDFNLEINHTAFDKIKSNGFLNCLNGEKTTLKKKCTNGQYLSSAEDNVLYKMKDFIKVKTEVIDFVDMKDCIYLEELQKMYSDHLPLQVSLNKK
jgi:deoxyribonuclease-1-like protein